MVRPEDVDWLNEGAAVTPRRELTTEECPEMHVGTGTFSDDVEMIGFRCTDDVFRERVPDGGSGSRKSSAADSGEFDRRHDETFPVKREPLGLLY